MNTNKKHEFTYSIEIELTTDKILQDNKDYKSPIYQSLNGIAKLLSSKSN